MQVPRWISAMIFSFLILYGGSRVANDNLRIGTYLALLRLTSIAGDSSPPLVAGGTAKSGLEMSQHLQRTCFFFSLQQQRDLVELLIFQE